jgi:ATP-dependent helicase/nuclease subunit A
MAQSDSESSLSAKPAPPPTPQQQAAIDTKHVSVVLSAGAGCGKTSVLTQRFLSHLAPGPHAVELSRLVAITFTERAAREMRERIRTQCLDRLRTCPPADAEHWLEIARSLDSARISTIHAFCSSLLRSHAVEAEIDPKFGLLDEMLGASFLSNAIDSGLHKLLADDDADAAELVFEFGLSRTRSLLSGLVLQRYRIDFAKWENQAPKELALQWDRHWHTNIVPKLMYDLAASQAARKTMELLEQHEPRHAVMQERRSALLEQIPLLAAGQNPEAILEAIRENARVQGGGTKKDWDSEEIYSDVKDVLTDLRGRVDKLREQLEYDPEHLLRGAEIGLCALRAAKKVGTHYDAAKRNAAVVDFDDLLLQARNLLRDHEDVRRRVSAGISLLMVDEFQDTDPIQDDIVQLLCGDAALTGKLFVVGDAKQSIYRFRRAEPKVFHQLRARIDAAGRLPLSKNFRSQPEILAFVNAVFDGALGDEYEPLEAASTQVAPPPCVEFLFATVGSDETNGDDEDNSAAARRRREADWIARRLKQLLTDEVPRIRERHKITGDFELRTVVQHDIVVLFRAMSDVRYYEEALRQHGLEYYVVGGRAFFAQQEVFDVVNLCQYLDNVDDQVSLVGVLRSPFFSLSDDAIVALGHAPARALAAAPPAHLSEEQQELVRFAGAVLAELREKKDRLSIAHLLNLAIDRTGYDAALLTEFLGARKLANLRKLVDMARQFDQSGLFTLADFVDRLRDAVGEEAHEPLAATHPESSNIIRLMSIHQSKGLEFPVVVVADMDRQGRDQLSGAHFDVELGPVVGLPEKFGIKRDHPAVRMLRQSERDQDVAESRRLFYVAATRAADLLILSANLKRAGEAANTWLKLVAERFDLLTGQPRQAPTADGLSILAKYASRLPQISVHRAPPELTPAAKDVAAGAISLPRFREAIEQSAPAPLPNTLRRLPPDVNSRRRFSVSALEDIDRELRHAPPAAVGEYRPTERDQVHEGTSFTNSASGDLSAAEQLGTLVHQVLERLDFRVPHEVPALIDRCIILGGRPMDESARTAAAKCISNLLGSPLGAELALAREIHREIDFLLTFRPSAKGGPGAGAVRNEDREFIISGTIDCLFESAGGGWIVLDYKTGVRDKSTSPVELLADYEIQLGLYALAVRQFVQRLPDRIELVFLRSGVDRVVFEPTEARLAEITSRVGNAILSTRGSGR